MEINYKALNAIKKHLDHTICVGEERTLTAKEVADLNAALLNMLEKSTLVNNTLQAAKDRFRNK